MSAANVSALAPAAAAVVCPSCAAPDVRVFYRVEEAPVHSVLQMDTRERAMALPKRSIALGLCRTCGLISNTVFDPSLHSYSAEYEETQGYSETFRTFHEQLARNIIGRHGIYGKTVIEIGCGKGEFLALLCRLGRNRGIGIDPAFVAARNPAVDCDVEFIADFYSERFAHYKADAIVCKMTLEHIHDTFDFVSLVRRSIGDRRETLVFFQVPDSGRILADTAFEDIYYEHCSYFNAASLRRLFVRCGFEVLEVNREYANQYLTLAAKPAAGMRPEVTGEPAEIAELERQVDEFSARSEIAIHKWRWRVKKMASEGKRIALWGSGSKGVAFLTAIRADSQIACVVDINPYRQGRFMAGSGHRIVSPRQLAEEGADVVIAMNPIYGAEIQRSLDELNIRAELMTL